MGAILPDPPYLRKTLFLLWSITPHPLRGILLENGDSCWIPPPVSLGLPPKMKGSAPLIRSRRGCFPPFTHGSGIGARGLDHGCVLFWAGLTCSPRPPPPLPLASPPPPVPSLLRFFLDPPCQPPLLSPFVPHRHFFPCVFGRVSSLVSAPFSTLENLALCVFKFSSFPPYSIFLF